MNKSDDLNIEENVVNFLSKITNLKSSLVEYVIRQNGNFDDFQMEIREISDNFESVHVETENIISKSSQISEVLFLSIEDREKYQRQISSLKTMKQTVLDLIALHKHIYALQLFCEDIQMSVECLDKISNELQEVKDKLESSSAICMQELKAYNTLLTNFGYVKGVLTTKLENLWEANIQIKRNMINPLYDYSYDANREDFEPHCKSAEINISPATLSSIIVLMYHLDIGCQKIGLLLRFITAEILYPSIENFSKYSLVVTAQENKLSIMVAADFNKSKGSIQDSISPFIAEFTNALTWLNNYLLSIVIPDRYGTILTLFQTEYFDVKLTDYLITNFLNEIVMDERKLEEMKNLIEFLHEHELISSSNQVLSDYLDDSDHRTRDNDIAILLSNTRKLLLKSMLDYEIVEVDRKPTTTKLQALTSGDRSELTQLKLIDLDKYVFPICKVSESVVNVVLSMDSTIEIFKDGHSYNYSQMANFLQLLPEMIVMYLYVVPMTNKDVMDQLPLASVIHYNNCMYLAHHCLKWTTEVKPSLNIVRSKATVIDPDVEIIYKMTPSKLLSLVYRFKDSAVECISKESNKQKLIISEFFEDFVSFIGFGNENKDRVNRAIKKCVFHLSSLSKIYDGLPDNIFDNVYGSIVDWALEQILGKILNMPDIVQADNDQMLVVLSDLKDKLIDIITKRQKDKSELTNEAGDCIDTLEVANTYLSDNCSKWGKLLELLFLLGNGLKAIEERWLNTSISMSKHITALEVRNIIKALFKNSNIRSKVIEKIV